MNNGASSAHYGTSYLFVRKTLTGQIDDELAQRNRQRAMVIFSLLLARTEEACHPFCLEGVGSPSQRVFCQPGLLRPFSG
jgi:hypothetical protein